MKAGLTGSPADRFLQGPERVGIGRFVETGVAIGNLQEAEARDRLFSCFRRFDAKKLRGFWHAPVERPNDAGSRPNHAFERAAPVDSFVCNIV
jgi:hypothetical protein